MTTRPETPPVPGHLPGVLRPELPDDPLSDLLNRLPASPVIEQDDKRMLKVTDELAMLFNRRPKS